MKRYILIMALTASVAHANIRKNTKRTATAKPSVLKKSSLSANRKELSEAVIKIKTLQPTSWDRRDLFSDISNKIIAKANLRISLKEEEARILSDEFYVFSKLGSTFTAIPFCKKYGDYDFSQMDLLKAVYYLRRNKVDFSSKAMDKIVDELLVSRGAKPTRKQNLGLCGIHEETENHILMIEISKYLTNQLLAEKYPSNDLYNNKKKTA